MLNYFLLFIHKTGSIDKLQVRLFHIDALSSASFQCMTMLSCVGRIAIGIYTSKQIG